MYLILETIWRCTPGLIHKKLILGLLYSYIVPEWCWCSLCWCSSFILTDLVTFLKCFIIYFESLLTDVVTCKIHIVSIFIQLFSILTTHGMLWLPNSLILYLHLSTPINQAFTIDVLLTKNQIVGSLLPFPMPTSHTVVQSTAETIYSGQNHSGSASL